MRISNGFSLIEISVILLIVGLMAGIVAGTPKLIQNSQDKRIMLSFTKYDIASQNFLDRYNQIPGDFSDATRYWPSCTDYVDTLTFPCNGNSDGYLGELYDPLRTDRYEVLRYWQHLALADYIEGSYQGTPLSSGNQIQPGVNAPKGPLNGSSFNVTNEFPTLNRGLAVFLSKLSVTDQPIDPDVIRSFGVFTPSRLLQFDSKFDDGFPNSGLIYGEELEAQACMNAALTQYLIGTENEYCIPAYRIFRNNIGG